MSELARVFVACLTLACVVPAAAQSKRGSARGRAAVLERLDQNIGRAMDGVTLSDKQRVSLDHSRQVLREAASARRDGLNEDKKATEKAFKDIEKVFKDQKVAFHFDQRRAVQEDVAKLRADARNTRERRMRRPPAQRMPSPFPRNPRRW